MEKISLHRQRGDTLLLVLLTLLVLFLGGMYMLRSVMLNSQMAGNTLARQKNVQVGDVALNVVNRMIFNASGNQALEVMATGLPWYRAVAPGTPGPDTNDWKNCISNSTCAVVAMPATNSAGASLNYLALVVVQPTNRTDTYQCITSGTIAKYYDVFIRIGESSGASAANTESLYKLCIPA